MKIMTLNRGEAQEAMNLWVSSAPVLPEIDSVDYKTIRSDLHILFSKVKEEAGTEFKVQDYCTDVHFGIRLFEYFNSKSWFTVRVAANDGFWRYLSVVIIPDIVAERWGKDNDSHYWSNAVRIWLKQLWWYVYLSWQGSDEMTREVMENSNCSTDTILNFVERSGKKGTCIEVYRSIIYYYTKIPQHALKSYNAKRKSDDLFRVVMKLNTARMMVMEPSLCEGGNKGYAKKLFVDAGINPDMYINE